MTGVFLSYASKDRRRVRLLRDALAAEGLEVFWDQEVPAGVDWDGWIRKRLREAQCAVVVWTRNSVVSDNVRHEAALAKKSRKLVPVVLDVLAPEDFPMGFYALQNADLMSWQGDRTAPAWIRFIKAVRSNLAARTASAKESASTAAKRSAPAESRPRKRDGEDQLPLKVDDFCLEPTSSTRRKRRRPR